MPTASTSSTSSTLRRVRGTCSVTVAMSGTVRRKVGGRWSGWCVGLVVGRSSALRCVERRVAERRGRAGVVGGAGVVGVVVGVTVGSGSSQSDESPYSVVTMRSAPARSSAAMPSRTFDW